MKITVDLENFEQVARIVEAATNLVDFCYPNGSWAGFLPITRSGEFIVLVQKLYLALVNKHE